ncbi:M48 family metallopeptidase [candidate division KSB1 bacterium]|nr:M48 family metallopeptidase [candidate division KSB1 bacterium]
MQFALLFLYLIIVSFSYYLKFLNLKYLKKHGATIPPEFDGYIDAGLLKKTRDYTVEHSRFGYISSIFDNVILLLFIFGGLLDMYNTWIHGFTICFILKGLVYFILLSFISTILDIPFDLYETFKIENKYGFNTKTFKLWLIDLLKSFIISVILMGIIGSIGLWLIQSFPDSWWLWVWAFFLIFSLFLMYISPYVIEPLFNKFTPITEEEGLEDKIKNVMEKAGLKVSRVFKIDASKRSRHTNAYFTGIGKVKRIVLFDTLLQKMNHDEIISVLAHEAGHWKKKHILKTIIISELIGFAGIYLAFRILKSDILIETFQISDSTFFVKIMLLSFVLGIVSFPFTPLSAYISRKHEREADRFACELIGDPEPLASALIKLSKDNLSNLHPHPFFAKFYYSHPPVVERIRSLRAWKGRTD